MKLTPKKEEIEGHQYLSIYGPDGTLLARKEKEDYNTFEIRLIFQELEYVALENEIFVTWISIENKFK
jgi:hypothetical protein